MSTPVVRVSTAAILPWYIIFISYVLLQWARARTRGSIPMTAVTDVAEDMLNPTNHLSTITTASRSSLLAQRYHIHTVPCRCRNEITRMFNQRSWRTTSFSTDSPTLESLRCLRERTPEISASDCCCCCVIQLAST